jgi:hypothetical protein
MAKSSSREVSVNKTSSFEERFTTGILLEASRGGGRRPLVGTLMVAEILMEPTVVSRHCLAKKSPPMRESEDDRFPSYLPLWLSEGERKILSEKLKCEMTISTR